jgi:hypothetical protein
MLISAGSKNFTGWFVSAPMFYLMNTEKQSYTVFSTIPTRMSSHGNSNAAGKKPVIVVQVLLLAV